MEPIDRYTYERRHRRLIWALILVALLVIGTFAASVIWANRAAKHAEEEGRRAAAEAAASGQQAVRESELAWCAIITSISQGQRERPPTTAAGREFADRIEALRIRFRCE